MPKLSIISANTSDSVTRVMIFGDSDSTHVEKNGDSTRVTFFTEPLESQSVTRVRAIFTKFLSSWPTNPVRFQTKKWAFVASVMIKIGGNFLSCLSSRAMLHFKDQISPTCIEGDLRLYFHWGVSRAEYIDSLLWFNVVFAYRDNSSGPHTVTFLSFPDASKVI